VIDYLQLMSASTQGENRATEISEISRSLKAMAKELDVPVVALSQLNRALSSGRTSGRRWPTCASRARSSRTPT
jgi:replicative DNA helicase